MDGCEILHHQKDGLLTLQIIGETVYQLVLDLFSIHGSIEFGQWEIRDLGNLFG